MSLDKAIEHGREHRRQYRGSKAIDATCRNHGNCFWCQSNRQHANKKREICAEYKMKELEVLGNDRVETE